MKKSYPLLLRSETVEPRPRYLNSLIKFAPKNLIEKFIVDDGSDPETQKFLASKSSDFTLMRNLQSRVSLSQTISQHRKQNLNGCYF